MSDPIASLTAEVERLAGLLRDANAEIARLRGEAAELAPGYYRVTGMYGWPEFWMVKVHHDRGVNDGKPYTCAWGLSKWGQDDEPATWAYRTYGDLLSKLRSRYPNAVWTPDYDRVPEMERKDAPTEPDRSGWPVLVAGRDGRHFWPDGNPAVMPSGEREDTFRAVVDGSCGDVFYASAQAAADAIEARLPEGVVPTVTPPKVGDRWGDLTPEQRAMAPVGSELIKQGTSFRTTKDDRGWYGDAPRSPWVDGYSDSALHPDHIITRLGLAPKPPPATDPPKLLIGMVYEWCGGNFSLVVSSSGWPIPADLTAIYDTIADYRAGRALWRR